MDRTLIGPAPLALVLSGFFTSCWTSPVLAASDADGLAFESFQFSREPAFGFCPPLDAVFSASIARNPAGEYVLEMSILELGDGFPPEPGCRLDIHVPIVDTCARETRLPPRPLTADEVESVRAASARALARLEPESDPRCAVIDPCLVRVFHWDGRRLSDSICDSPRLPFEEAQALVDLLERLRGAPPAIRNGDANGDGKRDVSDAVHLLNGLFLGGDPPARAECQVALPCDPDEVVVLENGDVNADRAVDISDAGSLLNWLFLGGDPPAPICSCEPEQACRDDCAPPARCVRSGPGATICTTDIPTCADLEAIYNYLTGEFGGSCPAGVGCHVLTGHCEFGLGGCWHTVNRLVSQEDLNALAARFLELAPGDSNCRFFDCDCAPPPASAVCVEAACEPGD